MLRPSSLVLFIRMYYLLLLPAVVVCFFTYLLLRWNQTKNYWLKREVPHLPPNPLLGSLNFIQNQNSGLWFRDMYKHFKTPYIGIWLVWKPAIIVNTPELARRILVKDSAIFRDRNAKSGTTDPIGSLNLFTVKDPVWTNIRRKLTSLFTSAKLRAFHDYISLKSNELLQRIERDRQKELELKQLYVDFTTDIIGTFSFGIESNATLTSKGPLRDVTNEFMRFSIYRGLCWFSIFFCSELVDMFRFTFFPRQSTDYFTRIFKTVTAQRKDNANGKESRDLVDYLLDIQNESKKNNEEISDEFLIGQAAILLLGGFDTTGSFLTYLTYELAYDSECQEKLYQELKAAEEKAGGQLDIHSVSDLPYLNCVIKECLRKYPIMGWLDRVASQDYQIDEKVTVKAGSVVYVNAIGMQYDPQYFPEPEKFNPDRFLPENEENITPYTFLPFGDGPRICIGQRFFFLVGRIAASLLFLKYKVRPLPNMPKPNDVKIDNRGLLLHPGEPLFVEFVPRAENVILK